MVSIRCLLVYLPAAAAVGAVAVEALSPALVTLRTGEGGSRTNLERGENWIRTYLRRKNWVMSIRRRAKVVQTYRKRRKSSKKVDNLAKHSLNLRSTQRQENVRCA